ncbi:SDR family oxidoreductase [Virgibacillus siamensis]|uniref:SDR family oxidoreductase n=1 Tax=Virgibacillus siamensis TaxID=480071 RepID=UPI000986CB15|nr:SDR family oxidoreductase [Virgibacillus siamensis]
MYKLSREQYPLEGRIVLITGVSRKQGIGYATARQAAAWGASIVIHHYQPHDKEQPWGADDLQSVIEGIKSELIDGAFLHDISGDFADPLLPQQLMEKVSNACGHIDALICNHALSGSDGTLGELTAEKLDKHWAINTRSTLLLAQYFARQHDSTTGRGRIIFMTSGQRLGPMPGEVAYAASKGALADITMTIADQLADQNITVNAVNPGPVNTGYLDNESWKKMEPQFPFGRFGKPEDPAKLITWLLTDEASWITGQIINSEGGFARWRP